MKVYVLKDYEGDMHMDERRKVPVIYATAQAAELAIKRAPKKKPSKGVGRGRVWTECNWAAEGVNI